MGIGNFLAESVAVSICSWLEHCGIISRYIPDTKPFAEHPPSNIFAVGLPYIPLYYAISCAWPTFASRAVMNYSPLNIWPFIVTAMLVHDAWFFAFHTVFHKFRRLYKHIHSMHHRLGASCSPFGNAYADALDIGLCFVSFHAALFLYLYNQPRWNPPAVIALIVVEVTTNIVGKPFILLVCEFVGKPFILLVCEFVGTCTAMCNQNVSGSLHSKPSCYLLHSHMLSMALTAAM